MFPAFIPPGTQIVPNWLSESLLIWDTNKLVKLPLGIHIAQNDYSHTEN